MDTHSRLIFESLHPLLKAAKACADTEPLYRSLCAALKQTEEALQPREAQQPRLRPQERKRAA